MEDARYFPNPFPDMASDTTNILDPSTSQLSKSYLEANIKAWNQLLVTLDKEGGNHLDWGDVSVYTGVSGYVMLYLHLEDDQYIQKAQALVEKAIKKIRGKRISFLCGDLGPLALGAAVYHKLARKEQMSECVEGIKSLKEKVLQPDSGHPDEILYGRAGYLYTLLFLQQKIGKEYIDDKLVRAVLSAILDSGRELARKEARGVPLMYQWHEKHYLGAAHGLMGILFMLLQAKDQLTLEELEDLVKPTIDFVASLQFPSGNLPSSLGNKSDRLVHWCHGSPGGVFLFAKAYQVFNEASYREHAQKAAQSVWEKGLLRKGYGLCHGTAGNGYALLYLYQVTDDKEYLYRAAQFSKWCHDCGKHGCKTPDRPMSLYEGLAGTIHFLADMANPEAAKFPGFVL